MQTKICKKCRIKKEIIEFYKHKGCRDGFVGVCKQCQGKINKEYYKKNSKIIKERSRRWNKNNREKAKKRHQKYYIDNRKRFLELNKKYHEINRSIILKKQKKYRKNNSKKIKIKIKIWKLNNKERIKKWGKKYRVNNHKRIKNNRIQYYKKNKEKIYQKSKEWNKNNPERLKKRNRIYCKNRLKIDIHYKLRQHISTTIYIKLKRRLSSKNGKSTFSFLPYTVDELKEHLEKQFEPWMNWNNWSNKPGCWTIDHIKPDSSFNYKSVEDKEFQECWALKNLRPLEWTKNLKKGNKLL